MYLLSGVVYHQSIISSTPRYMDFSAGGFDQTIWVADTIRAVGNTDSSVNLDRNSCDSHRSL